jgi:hypothetical protein
LRSAVPPWDAPTQVRHRESGGSVRECNDIKVRLANRIKVSMKVCVFQAKMLWRDVPTKTLSNLVTKVQEEDQANIHVDPHLAFNAGDAYALGLTMWYLPNLSEADAIIGIRGRHKKTNSKAEFRALREAGVLNELYAKEDILAVTEEMKRDEKDDVRCAAGKKAASAHVRAAYRLYRPAANAGRGRGVQAGAGRGRGGGGPQPPFRVPLTVGPGVEGRINRLVPPGGSVAVRRQTGCFVGAYQGEYVQSVSWYQRKSTTEAARILLSTLWQEHSEAADIAVPTVVLNGIRNLNLADLNIVNV